MLTTYGTFFFFWKKNKQPLLKFSIKIHICIIIHFKAIREEWERSKENCRVSPLFVFLNRAERSHWSFFFSVGTMKGYSDSSWSCTPHVLDGTKRWIIRKKPKTNGRRHCRFPCLATNSFEETKNYFRLFFPFKHFYLTISKTLFFFLCNTLFV